MQYGVFDFLVWLNPPLVSSARNKHLAMTTEKVRRRLNAKTDNKDFFSYILANNDEEKLGEIELTMLASTLIVAGSGTAAGGLAGITYLLLRNPEALEKLKREVRTAFDKHEDITMISAQGCKYLKACITEGMRLYPPTPGTLPRWVPGKGELIEGRWVPGGYAVGVNQLASGHSEVNFHRASEFLPERWLDVGPDSEFASDDRAASQPFSLGSRNCIGKAYVYFTKPLLTNLSSTWWRAERLLTLLPVGWRMPRWPSHSQSCSGTLTWNSMTRRRTGGSSKVPLLSGRSCRCWWISIQEQNRTWLLVTRRGFVMYVFHGTINGQGSEMRVEVMNYSMFKMQRKQTDGGV